MCFVYLAVTDICQEQLVNWGPAKQTWAVTGAPESWNGTSCWVRDNTPLFSFFSVVAFNVARLSVLLCSPIELPVSILGRPVAVVAQRRNMYICIQTRPSSGSLYMAASMWRSTFLWLNLWRKLLHSGVSWSEDIYWGAWNSFWLCLKSILTDSEFHPSLTVVYGPLLLAAGHFEAEAVQFLAAFVRQVDETCDGLYSNMHWGSILYIFSQKPV